ncbi:MAG: hypothetical protein ACFCUR_08165 [Rhodomicrobiaceae bacterium]
MTKNDAIAEITAAAIEARAYAEAVAVALVGNDPARHAVAAKMMTQVVDAVRRLEDLVEGLR